MKFALTTILAFALFASWCSSAFAQPGYFVIESLDSMVANADYVCIATINDYERINPKDVVGPQRFNVKFAIEEKLKSPNPLDPPTPLRMIQISANPGFVQKWEQRQSRLLVASDWENPDNNSVVELEVGFPSGPKTLTADFKLLHNSDSIVRAAREAISKTPAHIKRIHTFALDVPGKLQTTMKSREALQLRVPVDERLEKKAQAFLQSRSPFDRSVGLRAIRYFKTEQNIAAARELLNDPYTSEVHQDKKRFYFYNVRSDAYNTFRIWGIEVEKPVLKENIEK